MSGGIFHNLIYNSSCNFADEWSFTGLTDGFGHFRDADSEVVTGVRCKTLYYIMSLVGNGV